MRTSHLNFLRFETDAPLLSMLTSTSGLPLLLGRSIVGVLGMMGALLCLGVSLLSTCPVQAQTPSEDSLSLAERYRTLRFQMLVQDYLSGRRTLPIQPVRTFPTALDTLFSSPVPDTGGTSERSRPSFRIDKVRRVRDLERSWFRERFSERDWSFLGAGTTLTFYDSTLTRDLRARLQTEFGEPTRTLAEVYSNEWVNTPDSLREDPIQFEYWFVVNDSIPVRVSDVNGPNERGVIVSTGRRYRDDLISLREALLHPLRDAERGRFVDYYYEEETRRWYRVGYDGTQFFRERISRFDIVSGRRPHLDTTRTPSPTPPDSTEAAPSLP